MGSTLGRVGMSALRPRQLFFWRMQREKSSSSWLSYDTMQRKLQTCNDRASLLMRHAAGHSWMLYTPRKEKATPFGVNLMRSKVLYRAAQLYTPSTFMQHCLC